jgi:tagatose 1,6-diphosphate aldolase
MSGSHRVYRSESKRGAKAFEQWLSTKGVENIENVNKALKSAHSWYDKVNVPALV